MNSGIVRAGVKHKPLSLIHILLIAGHLQLKKFRGKGKNLHVLLVAQLTRNRPDDTSAPGVFVVTDDNGRILVETDVGAVLTANAGSGSHDNRLHNIALLNNSAGCCFFNGSNHDVADICIPPALSLIHI